MAALRPESIKKMYIHYTSAVYTVSTGQIVGQFYMAELQMEQLPVPIPSLIEPHVGGLYQ